MILCLTEAEASQSHSYAICLGLGNTRAQDHQVHCMEHPTLVFPVRRHLRIRPQLLSQDQFQAVGTSALHVSLLQSGWPRGGKLCVKGGSKHSDESILVPAQTDARCWPLTEIPFVHDINRNTDTPYIL